MPVSLILNDQQLDIFNAALKGKSIDFKTIGRSHILLTAENWQEIRDAIKDLHDKKFGIRTKTVEHLETCYYAYEIIGKIHVLENDLRRLPLANDNKVGVVASEEPETPPVSTTVVETTPEEIAAKTEAGDITPTESEK